MSTTDGKILNLECHESVSSTIELAKSYAAMGYNDGYVVISEHQTRVGATGDTLRSGESEHGIYISCILRPSLFPSQMGFISAITAVSLLGALDEHTTKSLGIGWISDIFCDGRKIGTTAIEGKIAPGGTYEYIIVSFYVRLSDADFPPRLNDLVKKVFESENTSIPLMIAKKILNNFFSFYPRHVKNPDKFMEIYRRRFIFSGIPCKYIENGKRKRGRILGIEGTDGRLIVELKDGTMQNFSGNRNLILPDKIKLKRK